MEVSHFLMVPLHLHSGDVSTCLFNLPHEDESLPRVLPGKLLSVDAQCKKDRGTSACFVSTPSYALRPANNKTEGPLTCSPADPPTNDV